MAELERGERLQIMVNEDELRALEDFRFQARMPSRAAAVRKLLRRDVLEFVAARDVPRLTAEVAQHLTNRDLRPVHQDRADGRPQGSNCLEQPHP